MVRNSFSLKILSVLLIFAMVLPYMFVSPAVAADPYPYTSGSAEVSGALNYLRGQQGTDGKIGDFATSAWAVMAIAAAGEDPQDWRVGSNPSIVDYLSASAGNAASASDYARMIMAIVAAGGDPTSFGQRNFVELLEATYDGTQIGDSSLLNDDFWGVMALVAAGVDPNTSNVLQDSLSFIISNQNDDGGWSWGVGKDSDVDDTASAIMALVAAGQSTGSTITNAVAYLKANLMDNGGFESWGSTNSASDSWCIDSIAAVGQDPTSTDWQSGSGHDPLDDLLTFQNTDGSFVWTTATPSNMALMTSYAICAMLGKPYPVAVLSPQGSGGGGGEETGVPIDVRIEGQNSTIWSGTVRVDTSTIKDDQGVEHQLDKPTVLGALDEAAKAGGFSYVVKNSSYGLYIYSINGEEPSGQVGWTYRVDYYSPSVGAADFVIDQTTPPPTPHHEIMFAYAEWGQSPLKVEVDKTAVDVGGMFTATVTQYDDDTGKWSPAADATVHADTNYTTGQDGSVNITINHDLTVAVYAEKSDCIRSNRVTVTIGNGSALPVTSQAVGMTADIIPAVSFTVSPGTIDFGALGPRDTSKPQNVIITNLGAWDLSITASVTDKAQDLYVNGIELEKMKWNSFSTTIARGDTDVCAATLTVPENYAGTGTQKGTLIFWAEAAP